LGVGIPLCEGCSTLIMPEQGLYFSTAPRSHRRRLLPLLLPLRLRRLLPLLLLRRRCPTTKSCSPLDQDVTLREALFRGCFSVLYWVGGGGGGLFWVVWSPTTFLLSESQSLSVTPSAARPETRKSNQHSARNDQGAPSGKGHHSMIIQSLPTVQNFCYLASERVTFRTASWFSANQAWSPSSGF
jgi:hypothetical protein